MLSLQVRSPMIGCAPSSLACPDPVGCLAPREVLFLFSTKVPDGLAEGKGLNGILLLLLLLLPG